MLSFLKPRKTPSRAQDAASPGPDVSLSARVTTPTRDANDSKPQSTPKTASKRGLWRHGSVSRRKEDENSDPRCTTPKAGVQSSSVRRHLRTCLSCWKLLQTFALFSISVNCHYIECPSPQSFLPPQFMTPPTRKPPETPQHLRESRPNSQQRTCPQSVPRSAGRARDLTSADTTAGDSVKVFPSAATKECGNASHVLRTMLIWGLR